MYKEKIIKGVLHKQLKRNGKWMPIQSSVLSSRLVRAQRSIGMLVQLIELRKEIDFIKRNNEWHY